MKILLLVFMKIFLLSSASVSANTAKTDLTLLLFGDSGTGKDQQFQVAEAMYQVCKQEACDFGLLLGDNFYSEGVTSINDPKFNTHFEKPYSKFKEFSGFKVYTMLGNHDWKGDIEAQMAHTKRSQLWVMPSRNYKVPNLPEWIRITVLDTHPVTLTSAISRFFDRDYEKQVKIQRDLIKENSCTGSAWNIVAGHNPLFSTGKIKNKDEEEALRNVLLPTIEACNVHLYLSGHEHFQEHVTYKKLNAVIQGAASQLRPRSSPLVTPGAVSRFRKNELGFAILKINSSEAHMRFFNTSKEVLYEKKWAKAY